LNPKKILILDYSTSRVETSAIKRWLPAGAQVVSLFIDTKESFPDNLMESNFTHIIHSGSELSITKRAPFTEEAIAFIQEARDKGIWQMGICYGHQLLCLAIVGKDAVRKAPAGFEVGWKKVTFTNKAKQILGVRDTEVVWQHHFDEVVELPKSSELLATNTHTKIQAYINYEEHLFGSQFHPEFDRESGNHIYLRDRELLESYDYDVEKIVEGGPSLEMGKIFLDFFLG
jgi:GMP synthase (glutamine-hydrolysing)